MGLLDSNRSRSNCPRGIRRHDAHMGEGVASALAEQPTISEWATIVPWPSKQTLQEQPASHRLGGCNTRVDYSRTVAMNTTSSTYGYDTVCANRCTCADRRQRDEMATQNSKQAEKKQNTKLGRCR